MTEINEHFVTVEGWEEAAATLGFEPLRPQLEPNAFRIHVEDHRRREVPPTLEVHYDGFVISQARRDPVEASRMAAGRYGSDRRRAVIGGHDAFFYELGPEPDPEDVDPREPALVTWADGDLFVLLASDIMEAVDLLDIAASLYPAR